MLRKPQPTDPTSLTQHTALLQGRKWWMEADEPWQALACCMEIARAVRAPNPAAYISHFPVHQVSWWEPLCGGGLSSCLESEVLQDSRHLAGVFVRGPAPMGPPGLVL